MATFFGVNQVSPGAYVIVNAPADIVGFEFIRRQGADLQGLNARSAEEFLNTLYFAQMAVLGPFETELGLLNYSSQSVIVVVTAHRPDGSLFIEATQQNPVTIALAPGGSENRDLQSLFGFQGDAVLEGWLEVTANTEAINGQLTYRVVDSGAAAAVAVVPQGSKASIFAHVATPSDSLRALRYSIQQRFQPPSKLRLWIPKGPFWEASQGCSIPVPESVS